MYSLIIIEDEFIIRNALINDINWAAIDCTVVGDADNGDQAIEILDTFRPDIVISDIKIYGKSGIEVCKHIHENVPNTKTILLTGYGEIEYAKAAIKYGVDDFILKPSSPEEIIASVKKLIGDIELIRKKEEELISLHETVKNQIPSLRNEFLIELSNGIVLNDRHLIEKLAFLKIEIKDFYVAAMEIDDFNIVKEKKCEMDIQTYKLTIRNIFEDFFDEGNKGYFINRDRNLFVAIIKQDEKINIIDFIENIQNKIYKYTSLSMSFGISFLADDIRKLDILIEQATYALRYKFYTGNGSIISFGDISKVQNENHTNYLKQFSAIADSVAVGNSDEVYENFNLISQSLDKADSLSINYYKSIMTGLIVTIQTKLEANNINTKDILKPSILNELLDCQSVEDINFFVKAVIDQLIKYINIINKKHNKAVIGKIENYLSENYSKQITLEDLGKAVYMNPKYVCRLIKKETGENFTDVLNKMRINKAKELITNIKYKTYEISDMVGISNSRYFSQMFKKYTGMTPSEYRNKHSNEI